MSGLVRVKAERQPGGQTWRQTPYNLTSLEIEARGACRAVRERRGIETGLHWALDLAFREDESRNRVGDAPHRFSTLRRLALNLLRHKTVSKIGSHARHPNAACDNGYLFKVLHG